MSEAKNPQVFDAYAAYYDLLYRDKDYAVEAAYVHDLLQKHGTDIEDIFEFGCGSGRHALELAGYGYRITGIDRSKTLIRVAEKQAEAHRLAEQLQFAEGDLRNYQSDRRFDAVVALFHVMSYQVGNHDLQAAVATAAALLRTGGIFLFDCWYGPAVLHDPPVVRIKRLKNEQIHLTRLAEPLHFPNENRVDVHYELFIESPDGWHKIREVHSMRYFFIPEIQLVLEKENFRYVSCETWLTGTKPGVNGWNTSFIAIKS